MTLKSISYTIALVAVALICSACTPNISPNTYTAADVGIVDHVVPGVIASKRAINIENDSGVGGAAGAVAGGAAGTLVGGNTATEIIGAVGGAVVGGVLGDAVDKAAHKTNGYEYVIKLNNGNLVSIVQTDAVDLSVGEQVLIEYGALTRVVPDTIPQTASTTTTASKNNNKTTVASTNNNKTTVSKTTTVVTKTTTS